MVRFFRGMVRVPSQPVRSRIILHPLAFVFHAQPVFGLVIAGRLFEIQTSTHNQLPFNGLSSAKCIPRFTACVYSTFYSKTLIASFTSRIRAEMVYLAGVHETAPHTGGFHLSA